MLSFGGQCVHSRNCRWRVRSGRFAAGSREIEGRLSTRRPKSRNLTISEPSSIGAMSPYGTMYALSSVRLKGRKPPHCRRSASKVGSAPNSVENSKSESSKIAENSYWIGCYALSAISTCQEPEFGYPLGQKLQPLLHRPDIFLISVKMEFFNGIRRIADLIWTARECTLLTLV
jgi:hypothetical protein